MITRLAATLALAILVSSCGASSEQSQTVSPSASDELESTQPVTPAVIAEEFKRLENVRASAARDWVAQAGVMIGSSSEDVMVKLPDDLGQRDFGRGAGSDRIFTGTFSDGSQIVLTFRPRGADGSGAGLVLAMMEMKP